MGLRIIGKNLKKQTAVTDSERLAALEQETQRWSEKLNDCNQSVQQEFIHHFCKVKARLHSPASVIEMAARIREDIIERQGLCARSHNKVDIATLLELL